VEAIETEVNIQGRVDYDWDLNIGEGRGGLLFSAGAEELFTVSTSTSKGRFAVEREVSDGVYWHFPLSYETETENTIANTAAFAILEYTAPEKKAGAELGLRVDHFLLSGDSFTFNTIPVFNPRLNLDYNVFRNKGLFDSLDLTAGTGLFSSVNDNVSGINSTSDIEEFALRPNRSWTSIVGLKTDIAKKWSFNIEGYHKYVFDRQYSETIQQAGKNAVAKYMFNGDGRVLGFDLQLQKLESGIFDGWISYTFTWAKYHESTRPFEDGSGTYDRGWYYPSFHRYHNINIVANIRPLPSFNIYMRLGAASGRVTNERTGKECYAVIMVGADGKPTGQVIEKWKATYDYDAVVSQSLRAPWVLPFDLKLSWYFASPSHKTKTEMYLAIEYSNLMSFFVQNDNTSFNSYTGREDTGSMNASYNIPIPMPSFGFRWSY